MYFQMGSVFRVKGDPYETKFNRAMWLDVWGFFFLFFYSLNKHMLILAHKSGSHFKSCKPYSFV